MLLWSILAILATAAPAAAQTPLEQLSGQFAVDLTGLLNQRIDPIIDPGNVKDNGHLHTIFGANNFGNKLNTFAQMQKATCTTAVVQADKSNYWIPSLMFVNPDGTYEPTWFQGSRAYYMVTNLTQTEPFPEGLRMISGTAASRLPGPKTHGIHIDSTIFNGGGNKALGLNLPNPKYEDRGPPDQIKLKIQFPGCGTGALDSPDHFSHMAWPLNGANQFDPQFGFKYPTLQLEVYWALHYTQRDKWRRGVNDINLAFANGDTVGASLHADFVNGWDTNVLRDAIKSKTCLESDSTNQNCPAFKPTANYETARTCRYAGMVLDENSSEGLGYFKPLKNLPGCNPRWDASAGTTKPTACPAGYVKPGWTWPNVAWRAPYENWFWALAVDFPNAPSGYPSDSWVSQFSTTIGQRFAAWGSIAKTPAGSTEDIRNNKNLATAPNKEQKIVGL
ncbi:hypothetical protein Q8F55_003786 [Vanrija albida]|uniref:DUF1996 domain-containing protein n=1 Tax=Vanrija albida TaxID=181172 RepID=A0ABR3Q4X9_9TREE